MLLKNAPLGVVMVLKKMVRTNDQNAKMWAMLSDISTQKPEGRNMAPEYWKCAFMSGLGHEVEMVEGIDGNPAFPMWKSSRLNKEQMADLITFIAEYGDRHGVNWSDQEAT